MPEDDQSNIDPTDDDKPTPDTPPLAAEASEVAEWKARARKFEDRAKANAAAAKELEALKASAMTDQEKAVAEAAAKARAEVLAEVGGSLVESAFKVAATGRPVDIDTMLDGLDRAKFLTDDGKPDVDRITAWIDKVAPAPAPPKAKDLGQGARPTNGLPQITDRAQLEHMKPEEIVKAREDGRLNDLLGIK